MDRVCAVVELGQALAQSGAGGVATGRENSTCELILMSVDIRSTGIYVKYRRTRWYCGTYTDLGSDGWGKNM